MYFTLILVFVHYSLPMLIFVVLLLSLMPIPQRASLPNSVVMVLRIYTFQIIFPFFCKENKVLVTRTKYRIVYPQSIVLCQELTNTAPTIIFPPVMPVCRNRPPLISVFALFSVVYISNA